MREVQSYFSLNAETRKDLLSSAAAMLGKADAVLEKDIWLCLTLEKLFGLPGSEAMAFKGGTSLSKVYDVIHRFSEDIDVTLDWRVIHENPPSEAEVATYSRTKTSALADQINGLLEAHIERVILPQLRKALVAIDKEITVEYELDEDGTTVLKDKLRVAYPHVTEPLPYVPASVLIEFGAKNDVEPGERVTIVPDVAEHFPLVAFSAAEVFVLSPKRTFWEKATLIHDACHRPDEKSIASAHRMSRHLYDLTKLAQHEIGPQAVADVDLLLRVVIIKDRFYRYGTSRYDLCTAGGFRLVPTGALLDALKKDYAEMAGANMFFVTPPSFEDILDALRKLESEINTASKTEPTEG